MRFITALEPESLVDAFMSEPPPGFSGHRASFGTPVFSTRFDLLTTAEPALRRRLASLPGHARWSRLLHWKTSFVGTPVSEYAPLPEGVGAAALLDALHAELAERHPLTILKDLPESSPLLDKATNQFADELAAAARAAGFALLEGQALAWVPIDFRSSDEYLARLSKSRRRDLRRKLRSRRVLSLETLRTGDARFADAMQLGEFYALFENVYAQSEIHFDRPSLAFFRRVFTDPASGGIVFCYRHEGRLIGWNLCYEFEDRLIDKYVGFRYPDAREHNLYFVSWMANLDYAVERGLHVYVAGWTDAAIKAYLGARFTFTRHAVYARNPVLRGVLSRISGLFESDGQWRAQASEP